MTLAKGLKHLHLAMTIFWVVMLPISIYTGIWKLVEYVTFLSLWALVVTHWGAWQASRAEVKVEAAADIKAEHVDVQNANKVEGS